MTKTSSKFSCILLTAVLLCLFPVPVLAAESLPQRFSSADTIWVLLGAALVFFMQPGFAMCETGLTRAKNAGNIVMKNVMDFALGTPAFWIIGFGLMFGTDIGGVIGTPDFFVTKYTVAEDAGYPSAAFLIFQTVFCATAATIVSGSMAERTKFSSYCIYSIAISLIIYPISGHWIWGGGWLAEMGFHDFAGSTAVHMVGGVCLYRRLAAGATYREIQRRRIRQRHTRPQPSFGNAGRIHPLVRLVRFQRLLHSQHDRR